jgi:hypothetical protein
MANLTFTVTDSTAVTASVVMSEFSQTSPSITFTTQAGSSLGSLLYAMSSLGGNYLPVPMNEDSLLVTFRIYNNYAAASDVKTAFNIYLTVFDSQSSYTDTQSPIAQSWVRIYETGFGEGTVAPGLYTQYMDSDTAIGMAGADKYIPAYGSDGTTNAYIRAGTNGDGVGFIEFATYVETPQVVGFANYSFAVSLFYEWTT